MQFQPEGKSSKQLASTALVLADSIYGPDPFAPEPQGGSRRTTAAKNMVLPDAIGVEGRRGQSARMSSLGHHRLHNPDGASGYLHVINPPTEIRRLCS